MAESDGYSKAVCKNCGGRIEFPSAGAGRTVPCPHCQQPMLLAVSQRRRWPLFLVTALVLGGAASGAWWYLAGKSSGARELPPPIVAQPAPVQPAPAKPAPPAAPVVPLDPWHGLKAGPITLEKAQDGHLIYAVGKLRNQSDRQRFGVKVELEVLDANDEKVGTSTDYTPTIEPGKEWKFRALVTDRGAAKAKLTAVTED